MRFLTKFTSAPVALILCACTDQIPSSAESDKWESRVGEETVFALKIDRLPNSMIPKIENAIVSLAANLKGEVDAPKDMPSIAKKIATSICEDGVFFQIKSSPSGLENLRSFVDVSAAVTAMVPVDSIPEQVLERVLKSCGSSAGWSIEIEPISEAAGDPWGVIKEETKKHSEFLRKMASDELSKRGKGDLVTRALRDDKSLKNLNAPLSEENKKILGGGFDHETPPMSSGWVYYAMPLRSPVQLPEIPQDTPAAPAVQKIVTAALEDWKRLSKMVGGDLSAMANFSLSHEKIKIKAKILNRASALDFLQLSDGIRWKEIEGALSQISLAIPTIQHPASAKEFSEKIASYLGLLSLPKAIESSAMLDEKEATTQVEGEYLATVSKLQSVLGKLILAAPTQVNMAVWSNSDIGSVIWGSFKDAEPAVDAIAELADMMQIRAQRKIFPITANGAAQNDQLTKLWVLGDTPEWGKGQPVLGRQGDCLSVSTSPSAATLAMEGQGQNTEGKIYLRAVVDVATLVTKTGILSQNSPGSELFTKEHRAEINVRPLSSNIMEIDIQTLK